VVSGIADALAQRPGRGLDAGGVAIFGMAGGAAADFAEMPDLLDGHVRIAGEIEQGIEQHRAMPGRKHETVAVGPVRLGRVEFQKARKENGGDIGHPHRQAGMAGLGVLHGVHREKADGIGQLADLVLLWGCLGHGVPGCKEGQKRGQDLMATRGG
jgi:hypothetical protein